MFSMTLSIRHALALAGLSLSLIGPTVTSAQGLFVPRAAASFVGIVGHGRYIGQVESIDGPAANPTGIVLALGTDTEDIRLGPKYTAQPQSAEAEVEGIAVGDYAMVTAKAGKANMVAQRVQFDVHPFGRLKALSGTITWTSPNDRRFRLRATDTGVIRTLDVVHATRFEMDGKPLAAPISIGKDQTVQVLMVKGPIDSFAAEINIRTLTSTPRRESPRT
jgi:hypothetical protein